MANPSDVSGDVSKALKESPHAKRKRELHAARRTEAVSLRLAGFSYPKIAERLKISEQGARDMVERSLARAENLNVDKQRALENERLDRALTAIWPGVLRGDIKSIDVFLRISRQRALISGLNTPTQIQVDMSIRQEMETALAELEELVLEPQTAGELENIQDAEVVEDGEDDDLTG